MDRLSRLIEQEKGADAAEGARKWLAKNKGDIREQPVLALLHEAIWQVLTNEPSVEGLAAYRTEFPDSVHEPAARDLEANMAYYAALKTATEPAFRWVVDSYAGTKAAGEALEKAAEAGFDEASLEGNSEAWSLWLSRYPNTEKAKSARKLLYETSWAEADAADTVEAWLEMRAANPDHPRAKEAREREATLAGQAASGQGELIQAAARYKGTVAGRSSLRRAVFSGSAVAVQAGSQPLSRGQDGTIRASFTETRHPIGRLLQSRSRLPADTVAVWIALEDLLPHKVQLEWMLTGIEPAKIAAEWTRPSEDKSMHFGPGAARVPGSRALGLRAEGFGNLEVGLSLEVAAATPQSALPAGGRLAPCLEAAPPEEEPGPAALLRRWEPCGAGLISSEPDGYWATTAEALAAAGVPVGSTEPIWGAGCPLPGFVATAEPDTDDDRIKTLDKAPPADGAAEPAGDDDDSAEPPGPPIPEWLDLAGVMAGPARDLDGDGQLDGFYSIDRGGERALVVVDGAGLMTRVLAIPADADASTLASAASHDGCRYVVLGALTTADPR